MIKYRDILDSFEVQDADGWGVLNPTSDSLRINLKPKLDSLRINLKPNKLIFYKECSDTNALTIER